MTRLFALGAILVFLTACASSPAKDARHASDLDVLVMGVEAMAQPREPAGDVKRAEDARTNDEAWGLLLDLEDVDWLHEYDKRRIVDFVKKATDRIKRSRQPCGWWKSLVNRSECRVD